MNKVKTWGMAIRPFAFIGSVIPVTLGAIFATTMVEFHWIYFVLSLLGIVSLQAGANLINDYFDYESKVDTEEGFGTSGIIRKVLSPKEVLIGGYVALLLGSALGIFLSIERGLPILIMGILGAACAYFYTGKPLSFKYKGVGAPLVFLIFGPIMVQGSFYVQAQIFTYLGLFISIPVGLLTTAILHANDIRDIYHDQKAGIKTLSIFVGEKISHKIYGGFIVVSYLSIFIMAVTGVVPLWSLICFLTLPTAIKLMGKLKNSMGNSGALAAFDQETAKLGAQFGIMFILSFLLQGLINKI